MAAHGMIQPEGDGFWVVFPYGGREYEVHSVKSDQEADVVLQCLMTWAKEDLQRSLEQSAAGCGGGVPAAMGSPQQLVQELQACVIYCNMCCKRRASFDKNTPAASWLMWAAADEGLASVVQQLLAWDPARALADLDAEEAWDMPLHLAALNGHAAVFQLLLDAAPWAAFHGCEHPNAHGQDFSEWSVMHSAARGGSTAVIEALLETQPEAAGWTSDSGHTPLHEACGAGHLEAARALLRAAPDTATAADEMAAVPLHFAAARGAEAVVELLLQAGPGMATATDSEGAVPLHFATRSKNAAAVEHLIKAAPAAALMEDAGGRRPFHVALQDRYAAGVGAVPNLDAARLLLPVSGLSPAQLLEALASKPAAQPLYADLAAHFPLRAADWQRVPTPCAGLGRALPAVLARSDAEARQLVQHLPAADRQHLRLAALCLGRTQHRRRVSLPAPLVRAILAQCLL